MTRPEHWALWTRYVPLWSMPPLVILTLPIFLVLGLIVAASDWWSECKAVYSHVYKATFGKSSRYQNRTPGASSRRKLRAQRQHTNGG